MNADTAVLAKPSVVLFLWRRELVESLLTKARVHVILHAGSKVVAEPELLDQVASVHIVDDFTSLDELSAVAADLIEIDPAIAHVLSFVEFSQVSAAVMATMLGLDSPPRLDLAARDKRLMKSLVARAGVPTARFWSVAAPSDTVAIDKIASEAKFPMVVKPVAGGGTVNTSRVDDADALHRFLAQAVGADSSSSAQFMAEEFVGGAELHVDAFWNGETALSFFVSEYFLPLLSTIDGAITPGSRLIRAEDEPELYDQLLAMNRTVNRALGHGRGTRTVTHMEVFRTPSNEVVFSEIATRIAGGWGPVLMSAALGRDVWSAMADTLVDGEMASANPVARHLAGVHIRASRPGVITAMPSPDDFAATPGLVSHYLFRDVGDELVMESASEWCAFAVIGADTAEALEENIRGAVARLTVTTRPVSEATG